MSSDTERYFIDHEIDGQAWRIYVDPSVERDEAIKNMPPIGFDGFTGGSSFVGDSGLNDDFGIVAAYAVADAHIIQAAELKIREQHLSGSTVIVDKIDIDRIRQTDRE